jgi:rhodanese-related sulfurtransferase
VERRIIRTSYALVLIALVAGCPQNKTSDLDVKPATYEQLVAMLNNTSRPTLLLDVRPKKYFAEGHLPGAVNIPLPDIVKNDARLGGAYNIVAYASHWQDPLARAAAKKMISLGYQNVFEFRGGVEQWQNQGRAIEKSEPAPAAK